MAKIGIDLDDVVASFIDTFVDLLNARHGKPERGTKPADWEWSNFGLTEQQQWATWKDVENLYNFWETLDVCSGVTKGLMKVLDRSHELFFITARVRTNGLQVKNQSANWLRDKFGIQNPTVIVSKEKGPLAAALGLNYFIDDRPKNCTEVLRATQGRCKTFLKDSSHNQNGDLLVLDGFDYYELLPRVKDFDEFANIVIQEELKKAAQKLVAVTV